MLDADRWAARYGFLRELWAGRSRVLADPALEVALRGSKSLPAPFAALLAELMPAGGGGQAWLLSHEAKPGTGRGRTGSRVAEFEAFEELLAEAPWQVAIVDLARHFVDAATLSRFAARAENRLENRLETRAFRLLTALAEGAEAGRVVVVTAPGEGADGLPLEQFQELVTQHFSRARIYALTLARAATVVDCGEVTSDEVEDDEDERGPVPLVFDNSLGEESGFDQLIAVVGAREVPRGVTLLELPPGPATPPPTPARPEPRPRQERGRADEDGEALRNQLGQLRRQLELASIARQSLVEQLDAAQSRIDTLEDQLAGRTAAPAAPAEVADPEVPRRMDAAAAALQSARWELEQLHDELRRVTARPVEEVERTLAAAEARLAGLPELARTAEALAARAEEPLAEELRALHGRLLELAG